MAREGEKCEFAILVGPPIIKPKPWIVRPTDRGIYKNLGCGLPIGTGFGNVNGCDELILLTFSHHSITVY